MESCPNVMFVRNQFSCLQDAIFSRMKLFLACILFGGLIATMEGCGSSTQDPRKFWKCQTNEDCSSNIPSCHFLANGDGVCVTENCTSDADCPSVGDVCIDGQLNGKCGDEQKCIYNPHLLIAGCNIPDQ